MAQYKGFKWTHNGKGFEVNVHKDFKSKTLCKNYAKEIIRLKGKNGKFAGLTRTELAAEIWAHAVGYYVGNVTIYLFNKGYRWVARGEKIQVSGNDPEKWKFMVLWYSTFSYFKW